MDYTSQLQAHWVWVPNWLDAPVGEEAGRLVSFRREFELSNNAPPECVLRLSADTRYKLLVNGQRVTVGPSRGSDRLWYYDTVDIAPYLVLGVNRLDILVVRWFPSLEVAIPFARTALPGLTVLGRVEEHDLSTGSMDQGWKGRVDESVFFPSRCDIEILLHVFEKISAEESTTPWTPLKRYEMMDMYGVLRPWHLAPRMIPLPEQTLAPFKAIRDADSSVCILRWESLFVAAQSIELPAHSSHRVELEYEVYATAFVRLVVGPCTGGRVKITYSECYQSETGAKGDRTQRDGRVLVGPSDTCAFSPTRTVYEPFWWRPFRFLVLEFTVGEEPLRLERFTATQTNYPMGVTAEWNEPANPEAKVFWDISVRTMRNCMFDGYSDCPFYEQLQYCEDARSAILFHYMLSGDDRLARQAITAFAASVHPDGLVCARYPAQGTQIITGFPLFWVLQVCDHMMHFDDRAFARQFLSVIDGVLEYFERHVDGRTGLVSGLPREYWSFVDWHADWIGDRGWKDPGVPRAGRETGTWSFFSMLYIYTLRAVCALLRQVGRTGLVEEYAERAERTVRAVREHCFDGHFYLDGVRGFTSVSAPTYSQHAQIWAILAGVVPPEEHITTGASLLSHALSNETDFAKCSYPMLHYAFRALAMTGLYDKLYTHMWGPWRVMVDDNLTTWEEDSVMARSDCHEWTSLPIWEFTTELAGLTPLEPGWRRLRFAPRLTLSKSLRARVNLGPRGLAVISWDVVHGVARGKLLLPTTLSVVSALAGKVEEREVDQLEWEEEV